ncbi:MAG: pseudouridine synthase [Lachnospiraceae bacterium]|nr:pseudouridine synthase [Lachnospiraceae bacterium]
MEEGIRLNKYMSEAGFCSRREADRLIEAGKVTVDGKRAQTGMRVTDENVIICEGARIVREEEPVILAVNKPVGVVCTTSKEEPANIVDFVGYPQRLYPVGRLDKSSEGLILMTNQGEMMERLLKASNYHEKEYVVRVDRAIDMEFLERMRNGVPILGTKTRKCRVEKLAHDRFRIVLTQGLNRQIRRMCEALGYHVVSLQRVRVMNIKLGNLPLAHWKRVEGKELKELYRLLGMEQKTSPAEQ